jgi:hypothetical protein
MKKIFVLLVLMSIAVPLSAQMLQRIGVPNASGTTKSVGLEAPFPVLDAGIVASPSFFPTYLSTSSVTFLSSIGSFTPPSKLEFRSAGVYFVGPATTTTVILRNPAMLNASGTGGRWTLDIATTSFDFGITLSPGEVASAFMVIQWPRGRAR